jgi:hypothetical protein
MSYKSRGPRAGFFLGSRMTGTGRAFVGFPKCEVRTQRITVGYFGMRLETWSTIGCWQELEVSYDIGNFHAGEENN